MGLKTMQNRLKFHGGVRQQDRMIRDKTWSMKSAVKSSYHGARFREYPNFAEIHHGLFNPKKLSEDYDTKMISILDKSHFKPGTIFRWEETNTLWIVFLEDKTELGYFRGQSRICHYKVQWVDKDRTLQEAPISVIGPSADAINSKDSTGALANIDKSKEKITILAANNEINKAYFGEYQTLVLHGIGYKVNSIDTLSMPGVIQIEAIEYGVNLIEDDVENDISNKWNVQPIVGDREEDSPVIIGPEIIKPQFLATFSANLPGGEWYIVENLSIPEWQKRLPAKIKENNRNQKEVHVYWDSSKSGGFTIGYLYNNTWYKKYVLVESLM